MFTLNYTKRPHTTANPHLDDINQFDLCPWEGT